MDPETISFRLPRTVARALAQRASELKVPKSQIIREALERYLGEGVAVARAGLVRERAEPYLGSLRLSAEDVEADDIARKIRQHNWRE